MIDTLFRQLSVFQGFNPEQLQTLRPLFIFLYAPLGTVLFEQGDPADCLYILADGEASIHYKPEDGPSLVIARVRAEGVIGWSAAIGNPFYTSSVICETNCEILRLPSMALRKLYEADPVTGFMFLERLAALIEARLQSNHPQLLELLEQGLMIKLDHTAKAG